MSAHLDQHAGGYNPYPSAAELRDERDWARQPTTAPVQPFSPTAIAAVAAFQAAKLHKAAADVGKIVDMLQGPELTAPLLQPDAREALVSFRALPGLLDARSAMLRAARLLTNTAYGR